MTTITLIRHGQASFGKIDYDQLSEKGVHQSIHLGEVLQARKEAYSRIYLGEMRRHAQTVENCLDFSKNDIPKQVLSGLNEFNHLDVLEKFEPRYRNHQELLKDINPSQKSSQKFTDIFNDAITHWICGEHDAIYQESWPEFKMRVQQSLQQIILETERNGHALIFTSGGVISVIVQYILGCSDEMAMNISWSIANASLTRLHRQGDKMMLLTLNDFSHFSYPHHHLQTWK